MFDGLRDRPQGRRVSCQAWIAAVALGMALPGAAFGDLRIIDDGLHLVSPYFDVRLSLQQPGFLALSLDGLGEGKPSPNALRPPAGDGVYRATHGLRDGRAWVEYRRGGTSAATPPGWRFEIGEREFRLISQWSAAERPAALRWNFDAQRCHVTLLGLMNESGKVRLPAVFHAPNQGSLRITSEQSVALGCDARRGDEGRSQLRQNHLSRRQPVAAANRVSLRGDGHLSAARQAGKGPGAARLPPQLAEHLPTRPAAADAGQQLDQRRLRDLPVRVCRHGGLHAAFGRRTSPRSIWCGRRSTDT